MTFRVGFNIFLGDYIVVVDINKVKKENDFSISNHKPAFINQYERKLLPP